LHSTNDNTKSTEITNKTTESARTLTNISKPLNRRNSKDIIEITIPNFLGSQ